MTPSPAPRTTHAVYPGGPPCQPNCPGEWSQYHDGYADGYENAEAASPSAGLRAALERIIEQASDTNFDSRYRDGLATAATYIQHQIAALAPPQGGEPRLAIDGARVHAAWRDGMLHQGRSVSPERMEWDTLSQQDRDLDNWIAYTLLAALNAEAASPSAGLRACERDGLLCVNHDNRLYPSLAAACNGWVEQARAALAPAQGGGADDDFRDRHERAFRDHILGAGDKPHTCDDLCSDAILDRMLLGHAVGSEYPLQPLNAVPATPPLTVERLARALEDAFVPIGVTTTLTSERMPLRRKQAAAILAEIERGRG